MGTPLAVHLKVVTDFGQTPPHITIESTAASRFAASYAAYIFLEELERRFGIDVEERFSIQIIRRSSSSTTPGSKTVRLVHPDGLVINFEQSLVPTINERIH